MLIRGIKIMGRYAYYVPVSNQTLEQSLYPESKAWRLPQMFLGGTNKSAYNWEKHEEAEFFLLDNGQQTLNIWYIKNGSFQSTKKFYYLRDDKMQKWKMA